MADAGNKCKFMVRITAQADVQSIVPTGFRFRFVDGSKVQTPVIGTAKSWNVVTASEDSSSEMESSETKVYSFEHSFPEILVNEEFALSMDRDPMLAIFLYQTQGAKSGVPDSNYAGLYLMDLSSLLSGNLSTEQAWSFQSENSSHIGVDATRSSRNIFPPTEALAGLDSIAVSVVVDQPMLTPELKTKLNPMTFTIKAARRLPGVANQGLNVHSVLHTHCRPTYVFFQCLPDVRRRLDESADTNRSIRIAVSPELRQGEDVVWKYTVVLLCASYNYHELIDALQNNPLAIELHDRDPKDLDSIQKLQHKWESLHTTGIDPDCVEEPIDDSSEIDPPPKKDMHPIDLPTVDAIAKADYISLVQSAGYRYSHGKAHFRLDELLNTARQWTGMYLQQAKSGKPYLDIKLSSSVVAIRAQIKAGNATVTPIERMIREPGGYLSKGTTLSMRVTLYSPIADLQTKSDEARDKSTAITTTAQGPFSRIVLVTPFRDDICVSVVIDTVGSINAEALPDQDLLAYQLTEEEMTASSNGALDIITGTQLVDKDKRIFILEGLADKGMHRLNEALTTALQNSDDSVQLSSDHQIRFTRRLYNIFGPQVKCIKLKETISTLASMPEIYVRSKVSADSCESIIKLQDILHVYSLKTMQQMNLFPSAYMLEEMDRQYGCELRPEDRFGVYGTSTSGKSTITTTNGLKASSSLETVKRRRGRNREKKYKAPTDSRNDAYEEFVRERAVNDYLQARRKESERVRKEYEKKKAEEEAELLKSPPTQVYMYSNQKLRTQDVLQDEMRKRLGKDLHGIYTYSQDFHSQTLSLVNPEEIRQEEEAANKKRWTTPKGFIYPAPRQPDEYYKHPLAPSAARCEDLRQPFVENENHPKPIERGGEADARGIAPFSTLPSKDMVFGGTNADGTVNEEYFRSVHLCGDGLQQEMDEALKREEEEWERKLVVDKSQLRFVAHGNICSQPRAKPSQIDRLNGMLSGSPRSKPLRIVKNAILPSGKRVPLTNAPASILSQQEYEGCVHAMFASRLRPTDKSAFLAKDVDTHRPKDFFFPTTTNILTPHVKQSLSRKEISAVQENEKQSLFWQNKPTI